MKADFSVKTISKQEAAPILKAYHYLTGISKGFKSGYNYGLFYSDSCVGVCIFTGFPVPELAVGLFGLSRNEQEGLFELSRLCICPEVQKSEYDITSWFVARATRLLRQSIKVRAILSYADCDYHSGTIYRALNFKYYGLTDPKTDFWFLNKDGTFTKHSRGQTKGIAGEWRQRSRKHRFLLIFDKSLKPLWKEEE